MTGADGAAMVEKLRQHRAVLLACEAIGWLHMTGKAHRDFLRSHGGAGVKYEPKHWHQSLTPDWSNRLGWVRSAGDSMPWPDALTEFLSKYDDGSSQADLVGLLQAAHAMASGIEKQSYPEKTIQYLGQDATHMWLVSPFGHPLRNLIADPPPVLCPGGWERLLDWVGHFLDGLGSLGAAPPRDADPWWTWREGAIGANGWLREAFRSTLAETRLPNNDVTLWDQSYVAAALFKSAVAGAVLAGASDWQNVKAQTLWRVLTVGLGADHYEGSAVRIGDWVGARRDIDIFFEDVRRLVEVDLAIGAMVYRDDATMAFTFPGLRGDPTAGDSKGSLDYAAAGALLAEIEQQIDERARGLDFETPPFIRLSKSTRSFIGMVKELREARAELAIPLHRAWEVTSISEQKGHICSVCGVRFNGDSRTPLTDNANKQRVCGVCARRRKGRLDEWLSLGEDTIWISEVADENGRVALLTFGLALEPWLEGETTDSLRAQSLPDWRRQMQFNRISPSISVNQAFSDLLTYAKDKLSKNWNQGDQVFRSTWRGFRECGSWEDFYKLLVADRASAPAWTEIQNADEKAYWIVHQLFCKLPSPGRVYRFWRAAEAFFDELFERFREISAAHPNRWRTRRLVLSPDSSSKTQGWEDRETYAGRWRDAPIELLYRSEDGAFVTISNLARCFDAHESKDALKAQRLELVGDDALVRTLTIQSVDTPEGMGAYAPVIVLDRSPERFRVLVPLDCASACVEVAIAKWRDELGHVWDRMPLRVGIVAFPRMTPFQAVVEAARGVEAALGDAGPETWHVSEAASRDGVTALVFEREGCGHELVAMPTSLPDGRQDAFYPYVRVEDHEVHYARDFRPPSGQVFRHALDLRRGDGVLVEPSRVAAVFLDTTARRFERPLVRPFSDFRRMRETWALLARVAPSLTALRGAWSELAERQVAWCHADGEWLPGGQLEWAQLARAVLGHRLAVSGAALDTLVEAAVDGTFRWAMEWHLSVLKERLEA